MLSKEEIVEKLEEQGQKYCIYENDENEWIFSLEFIFYRCKSKSKLFREYNLKNRIDMKIKNIGDDFKCFLIGDTIFYVAVLNNNTFDIYAIIESRDNYPYSSHLSYDTFITYFIKKTSLGAKVERIK